MGNDRIERFSSDGNWILFWLRIGNGSLRSVISMITKTVTQPRIIFTFLSDFMSGNVWSSKIFHGEIFSWFWIYGSQSKFQNPFGRTLKTGRPMSPDITSCVSIRKIMHLEYEPMEKWPETLNPGRVLTTSFKNRNNFNVQMTHYRL